MNTKIAHLYFLTSGLLRYYVAVTTQKISCGVYCRVVNPVTIIDLVKWLIMALSLVTAFFLNHHTGFFQHAY